MSLKNLSDQELHRNLQGLVSDERLVLTKVLHHLREVERRKLFCDFGCSSLWDYAVSKLGYSESQAHRRIQAMRLMRELPQLESKIAAGALNLSNIAQAQSLFNEVQRHSKDAALNEKDKLDVLKQLEHKSTREAQKVLLKLRPDAALPKERERHVTESQIEVRFVIDDQLKAKLEKVRSLMGNRGIDLSYAELLDAMADLSLQGLKAKKFGVRRTAKPSQGTDPRPPEARLAPILVAPQGGDSRPPQGRYISQKIKQDVWQRDRGECRQCGSNQRLNFDHIVPLAKGGKTEVENLRLLCFHCNQRAAMKSFGLAFMDKRRLGPKIEWGGGGDGRDPHALAR